MSYLGQMANSQVIPIVTIRHRCRIAREEKGVSQQELADIIGISVRTVTRYETGATEPRELVLRAWAEACHVDLDWLRYGDVGNVGRRKYAPRDSNPEPSDSRSMKQAA